MASWKLCSVDYSHSAIVYLSVIIYKDCVVDLLELGITYNMSVLCVPPS